MRATTDNVTPGDRWEFDADVTAAFDDMLTRSIPQYEAMRDAVTDLGAGFLHASAGSRAPRLLDLGSSRGEAVRPFIERFGDSAEYTLTEVSQPMLDAARENFADVQSVDVTECDLRYEFPALPPQDLITSVLTLLFTPIEFRQHILRSAYDALQPGGALIVVEKLLPSGSTIDAIQTAAYWRMKYRNGYTVRQIAEKAKSLQGVQVCLTDEWNRSQLFDAGFHEVDCFWRWMNFAGYVAVKS